MTRDETKVLLLRMAALYPNFKPSNLALVVDSWYSVLKDKDVQMMDDALTVYANTDTSGFAPSIGQLNALIAKASVAELDEGEIRDYLIRASRNANYGASDEFDRLPEDLQRAVGSSSVIQEWGMMDQTALNFAFDKVIKSYQRGLEDKRSRFATPKGITLNVYDRIAQRSNLMLGDDYDH